MGYLEEFINFIKDLEEYNEWIDNADIEEDTLDEFIRNVHNFNSFNNLINDDNSNKEILKDEDATSYEYYICKLNEYNDSLNSIKRTLKKEKRY